MCVPTKQKLIQTANELIWRSSYGSVSVDEICKTAGVKKGSFYHFFKSKADLAMVAMEDQYEKSKPMFDEIFSPTTPPIERFKKLATVAYEMQKETLKNYGRVCGCPFAALGSEMAGQEELIRSKVEEIFARKKKYLECTLRDLVSDKILPENTDIKSKANELHNYIMGQVMMARILNSLEPLEYDLKSGLFQIAGIKEESVETV